MTRIEGWLWWSVGVEDTISFFTRRWWWAGSARVGRRPAAQNNQNNVIVDLPLGDTNGVDPQVGLFYSLPAAGRVRATYSRKTRLPTMSNRYSHKFGFAIPNPELKPERSDTFETG